MDACASWSAIWGIVDVDDNEIIMTFKFAHTTQASDPPITVNFKADVELPSLFSTDSFNLINRPMSFAS